MNIYGNLYNHATGELIRAATRLDWYRAQRDGDPSTGAHVGVDGILVRCDGPRYDPTTTREDFLEEFDHPDDAIEFESAVLSAIPEDELPDFARAVRGGEDGTAEYWSWLIGQLDAEPAIAA